MHQIKYARRSRGITGPTLLACSLTGVWVESLSKHCGVCKRRGASIRGELAAVSACEPCDFSGTADSSSFCPWLRNGAGASCLHCSDVSACEAAQLTGSGRRYG